MTAQKTESLIKQSIHSQTETLFDNAYNFEEVRRIMHNQMAKHNMGWLRSHSYWWVVIEGERHQFDTFGEAFKFALIEYVKRESKNI